MKKRILSILLAVLMVVSTLTIQPTTAFASPDDPVDNKVQLWDGGPYFATTNIGATNPEDYGYYFWWGDTVGYTFDSVDKWASSADPTTKIRFFYDDNTVKPSYNKNDVTLEAEGWIDRSKCLAAAYDAATVKLGDEWRMPTSAEWQALLVNCYLEWTDNYNNTAVKGLIAYKVKSADDKGKYGDVAGYSISDLHIFLPAAGLGNQSYYQLEGTLYYWSSTVYPNDQYNAYNFTNSGSGSTLAVTYRSRYFGLPIRAVSDAPQIHVTDTGTITFMPWNGGTGHDAMPTTAGNYYLTCDITPTAQWVPASGTTNLCLNGHVLTLGSNINISLSAGVTLNIYDCDFATKHYFTVDATNGLWTLTDAVTENVLTGGVITGCNNSSGGGAICLSGDNDTKLILYGGNIVGNIAQNGGGVNVGIGTFYMTNGTITGNTAQNGGGVYATGDSICVLTGGTISGNTATVSGGGLYLQEEMCFVAGTPITMADGTRKPIETLEIGDLVRVFDHDTGSISTAKLFDVGKYPEKHSGVLTLHFSHDIDLTVVYGHSFFEREANKYVTVSRDNVESFVGHEFYNVDDARWETLTGYELVDGAVDTYIITSEKHLNSVANGMLNNEDGFYTMLTNIFEFGDGLKTDAEKKAKDIEKYGLWSFDNAKYISRNTYDVLNLQYLNVAFGKGMITPERFDYLEAFWTAIYPEGFCDPEENELDICLMLLGEEPLAPTFSTDPGVYVGGTLKITGNSSGNLYLPSSKQITIGNGTGTGSNGAAAPTAGFTVGVSTASAPTAETPVAITTNGTATDVAYFTSDNADYQVVYSSGNGSGCLELRLPSYTVAFDMNGHGTQVASQTVTAGETAECPANPSESGWTFAGWYGDAGLATPYAFTAAVNANTTIYAKWTQNAPTPDDPEPYYPPIIPETIPEPAKETTENYAVPVESEENSVQVKAKIEGGTATVGEITEDMLNGIVGKKTSGGGDADVEKAGTGRASVSIDLSGANLTVTGAEFTKKSVENLANITKDENNDVDSVVINMPGASVELDAKTLETLQESMAGDTLKLVVDSIDVESLNKKQLDTLAKCNPGRTFEAYFESKGEKIHDFNGGTAKVSVEFTPEIGKSANNYKACYLDENGTLQKHTTKYENGMLTFITGHFSEYAIIYDGVKDVLLAEAETTKKGYIKLSWNETEGAVKYVVYGAKCGKSYKKLTETESNSFTAKKISGAKPVAGKTYKLYVVAYDALGNAIKSKAIHYIAGDISGKYANVETITALTKSLELTVDEKAVADAGYTMYGDKKHTPKSHGKALRFTSDCPEVVKVLRDGTITAMKAGTVTIYIQDISGKWCTMEVTVKEK